MPLSEAGQTYLIYTLRVVGLCVGAVTTALGFYVLISHRDTAIRDVVLDIYRIVFGQLPTLNYTPLHSTALYYTRPHTHCLPTVLTRLYVCAGWSAGVSGLLIIAAELRLKHLLVWFSFLLYYIGLGLFYVFVGGLAGGSEWYEWIVAIAAVVIGFTYCAVGCMCSDVERRQHQYVRADVEKAQM